MVIQFELAGAATEHSWAEITDAEFLKAIVFKRGAAGNLGPAAKRGDVEAFITALRAYYRGRQAVETPSTCRAVWSLPAFHASTREQLLAEILSGQTPVMQRNPARKAGALTVADRLETWWKQAGFATAPLSMWEYLALLESFPVRIHSLPTDTAFQIWRELVTIALNLDRLAPLRDVHATSSDTLADVNRYGYQADPFLDLSLIRNCELPWLAGVVLAPIRSADKLQKSGAELLEHELVERTDDHGIPHGELLARLPLWLAVFTRVLEMAREWQVSLWDEDATALYQAVIEKVTALISPDGTWALSHVNLPHAREFATHVLTASGWEEADAALATMFPPVKRSNSGRSSARNGSVSGRRTAREPGIAPVQQSDDAAWALMRTNWGPQADRCTILHDRPEMNIELMIQGQPVLAGEWHTEISLRQVTTPVRGEWYCVCWQTDEDGDYIEMQMTVEGVVQVERQVLLSRTHDFCFLAETVSRLPGGEFQYRTRLPLVEGLLGETSASTREIRLASGNMQARVFPLALPDQHSLSTPGRFEPDLTLETTVQGKAWYNPVLIDWSPTRQALPPVWKALTVAEEQKIVAPDIAAGYRLKVGGQQWLIYRSLKKSIEARSLLGYQTRYETVVGSVESTGEITPFLLVE